jgi:type IV pilus assembly protein PilV
MLFSIEGARVKHRLQTGFTLAEVLIAMLVLSIGLTGVAAIELHVLRSARQTFHHASALRLAIEIADMLQAGRGIAGHRLAALEDLDYLADPEKPPGAAPEAANCYSAACDRDGFVAMETDGWRRRLHAELPAARLRICRDVSPWVAAGQRYRWECDAGGAAGDPLVVKIGWHEAAPASRAQNPTTGGSDADAGAMVPRVVIRVESPAL